LGRHLVFHVEFLDEVGLGIGEGREGASTTEKHPDILETLVEAADEVKD